MSPDRACPAEEPGADPRPKLQDLYARLLGGPPPSQPNRYPARFVASLGTGN